MFSVYSIPPLITASLFALLGGYVYVKKFGSENRSYALWCLSTVYWQFCWTVLFSVQNENIAYLLIKIGYTGIIFIPIAFYSFVISFIRLDNKPIYIAYGIGSLFATSVWVDSLFINGLYHNSWGFYPRAGILHPFYLMFLTCLVLHGIYLLFRALNSETISSGRYIQTKWVIWATLSYSLASIDFLVNYGANFYPAGFAFTLMSLSMVAYAITKHRLMDISVIVRKTLIYSVVTGALTIIYLAIISLFARIFEGFTGYQTIFSSAIAAGLITMAFQPLRKRVQEFVDTKFFRQYVDREEKLYELSREVITHTTPEAMGDALMNVIKETLHPKQGALFLRSSNGNGFTRVSGVNAELLSKIQEEDNALALFFRNNPQPFLLDLEKEQGKSYSTRSKEDREDAA